MPLVDKPFKPQHNIPIPHQYPLAGVTMTNISTNTTLLPQFLQELSLLQNHPRAKVEKKYHKSSREHWGVSVPDCTKLARQFGKKLSEQHLITLANDLWQTGIFDAMTAASKILALPKIKASTELWQMVCSYLKDVDGWALEDHLARTGWKCIAADEQLLDQVEQWTKHANFWMRRAALIFTLPYAKPGQNPERMLGWASQYASDPEWFIQKAIGWWLRDLGKHNPKRVIEFLNQHWPRLKTVARKEATRKLGQEWVAKLIHRAVVA